VCFIFVSNPIQDCIPLFLYIFIFAVSPTFEATVRTPLFIYYYLEGSAYFLIVRFYILYVVVTYSIMYYLNRVLK
jgi:hypothetical protein